MSKIIEIIDSDDESHAPTSSANTSTTHMESDDNQQSHQSRRRRRKSVLHAMTDPDMQFQTISLEDDDDDVKSNICNQTNHQKFNTVALSESRPLLKVTKVVPKLLAPKPLTNEEIVDAYFEKFLGDPETINDLFAIAEERARINYLLSINGIPEINFALYTRPERLQYQFEERLKQRKMLNNWDNTRLQDNRRSFLQKNEE